MSSTNWLMVRSGSFEVGHHLMFDNFPHFGVSWRVSYRDRSFRLHFVSVFNSEPQYGEPQHTFRGKIFSRISSLRDPFQNVVSVGFHTIFSKAAIPRITFTFIPASKFWQIFFTSNINWYTWLVLVSNSLASRVNTSIAMTDHLLTHFGWQKIQLDILFALQSNSDTSSRHHLFKHTQQQVHMLFCNFIPRCTRFP